MRGMETLAAVMKAILPDADIRTDQCDIVRVHYKRLLGACHPLPGVGYAWSIADLDAPADIAGVAAPAVASGVAATGPEAAKALANRMA
jgi:hypothetical protein